MFYINDERLTKEVFPDLWNFYQLELQRIRNKVHIPVGDTHYKFIDPTPIRFGNNGTKEPRKNIDIPTTTPKDGYKWTWCESSSMDKNRNRTYTPTGIMFHEKLSLDPSKVNDADKIFYFMHISGIVKNRIKLQNLEEEAKKKNETEERDTTVKFYILSKHSPLSPESNDGSDEKLRTIAYSWQIPNSNTTPLEILRRKIIDAVTLSEKNKNVTKRGFEEFIKESNDIQLIKLKSDIQKAVDLKVIELTDNRWRYVQGGQLISTVIPEHFNSPIISIETRLSRDSESNKLFYDTLNYYVEFQKEKVDETIPAPKNIPETSFFYTKEKVLSMEWQELKRVANAELKLGVSNKANKEEYQRRVIEALKIEVEEV